MYFLVNIHINNQSTLHKMNDVVELKYFKSSQLLYDSKVIDEDFFALQKP